MAHVYDDELVRLGTEEGGSFSPSAAPTVRVDVRLAEDPRASWDMATSRVRFRVAPGQTALRVGTVGWVTYPARPRRGLLVADSCVLPSAEGPYVLLRTGDGEEFVKRLVGIGKVLYRNAFVVSGLREDDRVAAGGFFLEADRQLRAEPSSPIRR
jgi:hypothetical protein